MDILNMADRQGLQIVRIVEDETQGVLVVEQHDSFFLSLAVGSLTLTKQTFSLQQRIGVTFYLRRLPAEVNTQTLHLLAILILGHLADMLTELCL